LSGWDWQQQAYHKYEPKIRTVDPETVYTESNTCKPVAYLEKGKMKRQTTPMPWFWLYVFLAWFTLGWTVTTAIMGNPPPPILLLLGIIQALIFQREWEKSSREEAKK
jgi:hypothetical protein